MSVSQELTSTLLSGADEEDALGLITKRVREVARADTSAWILPGIGDSWVCELADGLWANELIGHRVSSRWAGHEQPACPLRPAGALFT